MKLLITYSKRSKRTNMNLLECIVQKSSAFLYVLVLKRLFCGKSQDHAILVHAQHRCFVAEWLRDTSTFLDLVPFRRPKLVSNNWMKISTSMEKFKVLSPFLVTFMIGGNPEKSICQKCIFWIAITYFLHTACHRLD